MKIITMSDIHGDFEAFDKALEVVKNSGADILAINGDLAGSVFEGKEKDYFVQIYQALKQIGPRIYEDTQGKVNSIRGFAQFLSSDQVKAKEELKKLSNNYLTLEKKAEKEMINQYGEFRKRFDSLDQRVLLVPGNWDGKCIDDVLAKENISNKGQYEEKGVNFIGYGGSRDHPIEMPFDLTVKFDEDEAFKHLSQFEDAEVVLMHANPAGFGSNGHLGEYNLLAYLYRNTPDLILTGHTHMPYIKKDPKAGTVVINPGKIGRHGNDSSGSFLELDINENIFVKSIAQYLINGKVIKREFIKN